MNYEKQIKQTTNIRILNSLSLRRTLWARRCTHTTESWTPRCLLTARNFAECCPHAHKDDKTDKYIETGSSSTVDWRRLGGGWREISRYPPTRDCTGWWCVSLFIKRRMWRTIISLSDETDCSDFPLGLTAVQAAAAAATAAAESKAASPLSLSTRFTSRGFVLYRPRWTDWIMHFVVGKLLVKLVK